LSDNSLEAQRFPQGFVIFVLSNFTQVYMVIHKTIEDFIVFLYVHISQADDMYDPNEMAIIKSKMKRLYPEGTDIEQKLYMTIREYNTFDRSKLTDLFQRSIEHFGREGALATAVLSDLSDIIMADGKVKADETRSLDRLRTIIDQHVVL
jgi:uncharacterized tellurite resistance protein B-like protein